MSPPRRMIEPVSDAVRDPRQDRPWRALSALVLGFFMIMIDTTIVVIANPTIQTKLDADTSAVIWVTSAYLLTYSVPLLVTGRLGDRFGPRRIYLIGMVLFTLASAACGLAATLPGSAIVNLIIARAVQGLGAALMTPQSMAVITRIFPQARRGAAMGLWGATAGVATLVGPILGGVLVDGLGWEWIFFINVPVGIVGFILAMVFVPVLETHRHRFDWIGVVISCAGMFLLVFGLQEGNTYNWNGWVWSAIGGGIVVLGGFVVWQRFNRGEPLVPLRIFRDRNFSLANGVMFSVGFATTAAFIPLVYFLQAVLGMTPTQSALMATPSALFTLIGAPIAGRLADRFHPALLAVPGLIFTSAGIWLYVALISPDVAWGWLLIPSGVMGLGFGFLFGPVASTATRNLPLDLAGAGSGVFNTVRQVGAVIGASGLAALMTNRIAANLTPLLPPGTDSTAGAQGTVLPEPLHAAFSSAMQETMILPASIVVIGIVCAAFFVRPGFMTPVGSAARKRDDLLRAGEGEGDSAPAVPVAVDDVAHPLQADLSATGPESDRA